jgi:hypothetical protein
MKRSEIRGLLSRIPLRSMRATIQGAVMRRIKRGRKVMHLCNASQQR